MKKTTLLLLLISSISFGQTKKIFHKSHSGKSGTVFMDSKNTFGPGMAPVRYRTPESKIKLNYVVSNRNNYPIVKLDTAANVMRFYDLKDSLIGCDRNYIEYLNHGYMVFDVVSNEFWVYQRYFLIEPSKNTRVDRFMVITDSLDSWESKPNLIRVTRSFIRDGENKRIIMSYPRLDHTLTSKLRLKMFQPVKSYPIIVAEKAKNKKEKLVKKQSKKNKKKAKIIEQQPDETPAENEEENAVPFVQNPPISNWLIWLGIFLLGFSIFIFMGIQQIVKEEIEKLQ